MLHRRHSFNWGLSIFCVVLKGLCFTKLCQCFWHWKWFSCKIYQYFFLSKAIVFYELYWLFLSCQMNHGTLLISWPLFFFWVITCAYFLRLHLVFFSLLSLIVLIIILLFIVLQVLMIYNYSTSFQIGCEYLHGCSFVFFLVVDGDGVPCPQITCAHFLK